ncbi:MAG TPA: hypothetical protein DD381_06625 [Lentisphaeria bacterium]|nr:MAG: hypothetical protein A2X47_13155 [Lentisphaerae bacterium GWF2_38_69]HBM16000.1 hypothetical protein [Lentisphaeria bacterium]
MGKKYFVPCLAAAISIISGCTTLNKEKISDKLSACEFASQEKEHDVKITYKSNTVESLDVVYNNKNESVRVTMPDGRQYELPRAMAASGVRYTSDDNTVFWSKGANAQFWIDGKLVFSGEEKE